MMTRRPPVRRAAIVALASVDHTSEQGFIAFRPHPALRLGVKGLNLADS